MITRPTLRYIIKPSLFQIIVCLLVAFALFGIIFMGSFSSLVLQGAARSTNLSEQTFTLSYQHQIAQVTNNAVARWLSACMLLVATVLTLTFVLVSVRRTYLAVKDEVIDTEGEVKRLHQQSLSARQPILKLVSHLAVIVGLVAFVFVSIQVLLPLWLALFGTVFTIQLQGVVVLAACLAAVGLTINLYAIWTLAQIVVAMH